MPRLEKLRLKNFRRFEHLEMTFGDGTNVVVGDNETGKSTILLAIDLTLSGSRSRVESIGVENLLCEAAVHRFLSGSRSVAELPRVRAELYLAGVSGSDWNGENNLDERECDGVYFECAVPDDYSKIVAEWLKDLGNPFPFEYYQPRFSTFSGDAYSPYKKALRHFLLDGARIDGEHAIREHTRSLFEIHADVHERTRLEGEYRRVKSGFSENQLKGVNARLPTYSFGVRTSTRSNLMTDLEIREDRIPLEHRGRGRQCVVKTEFALSRGKGENLDLLLLEEPENHLSHTETRKLLSALAEARDRQLIVATHSSLICSRLNLRNAQLLGVRPEHQAALAKLTEGTADFFRKAPDNGVLELALSSRVLLVEGDAEYILMPKLYEISAGCLPDKDKVHVISVGGTSFKRYMELAKLLGIRVAVIRDNDKDFERNCEQSYSDFVTEEIKIFADPDNARYTFEVCLYADNTALCDTAFSADRRSRTVLEYMLAEKSEAALRLLDHPTGDSLKVPQYIQAAIEWLRRSPSP